MSLNVKILEESFACIKPKATQFASKFYYNLFNDYPELEPLFANTNMEEQEKKLIQSLVLVIYNLRNLAYLKNLLKDLGERHIRYGTVQAHYPMVGAALLKTLKFYLGNGWTKEVEQAWTDAYTEIVNIMLSATKSEEEISELETLKQHRPNPTIVNSASTQPNTTAKSLYEREKISELEPLKQHRSNPTIVNSTSTQPNTTAKSLYEREKISELEPLKQHRSNPTIVDSASTQPDATTSRFNLKLLLILFIIGGFLSLGLLYYHSTLTTEQQGGPIPVRN